MAAKASAVADPPLTAEERRALVTRPFPAIRSLQGGRSWGGTSTVNWIKDNRERAYTPNTLEERAWQRTVNVNDI